MRIRRGGYSAVWRRNAWQSARRMLKHRENGQFPELYFPVRRVATDLPYGPSVSKIRRIEYENLYMFISETAVSSFCVGSPSSGDDRETERNRDPSHRNVQFRHVNVHVTKNLRECRTVISVDTPK